MFLESRSSNFSRLFQLFILLSFGLIAFSSCKKNDGFPIDAEAFEQSYQKWLAFKSATSNNYTYTTFGGSGYGSGGFKWTTRLQIKNGIVNERHFEYQSFYGVSKPKEGWSEAAYDQILQKMNLTAAEFQSKYSHPIADELSWIERGDHVGRKQFTSASAAWNLDRVYAWTKNLVYEEQHSSRQVVFEAKNDGLVSACGVWIADCQDDCFNGIYISNIKPL